MNLHTSFLVVHFCYIVYGEIPTLQNIETIDDFSVIKEKSVNLGSNETYDKLEDPKDIHQECLQDVVDFSILKNELEGLRKTALIRVFKKYCGKLHKIISCVQNFTSAFHPGLNNEESKILNTTLVNLQQMGEFVCFRDGDRIATEDTLKCIKNHMENIRKYISSKINPTEVNSNSLMDMKKCDDLEKCGENIPTTSLVEEWFELAYSNKNKRRIRSTIKLEFTINPYIQQKLKKIFEKKCKENCPERGFEIFQEALDNTTKCMTQMGKTYPMLTTPNDKYKENIKNCTKNLIEAAENCLPDEEKYWPEFQMKSMLNVVDFVYKHDDKMRLQSTRTEISNCVQNFKQLNARNAMIKCLEERSEPYNLKKEIVCKSFENIIACISDQLKTRCIREITIIELASDFFNAFLKLCNENN